MVDVWERCRDDSSPKVPPPDGGGAFDPTQDLKLLSEHKKRQKHTQLHWNILGNYAEKYFTPLRLRRKGKNTCSFI